VKSVEILSQLCLIDAYEFMLPYKIKKALIMDIKIDNSPRESRKGSEKEEFIASLPDEEIINILNRDYSHYMYSVISSKFRLSGLDKEDVEDCFIELIIKLSENGCAKIRQFKGRSSFKTYLTVLCRNIATDYIRREIRNKDRIKSVDSLEDGINGISDDHAHGNPEARYILMEEEQQLKTARLAVVKTISGFPSDEKLLVSLKFERNMTYREMDEFLGIDNSRYRLSKILQKIRDSLDDETRETIEELISGENG